MEVSEADSNVNPPEIKSHETTIPQMDGDIVFVELCAGSAVLSATAREKHLKIFPVDCSRNRHVTHAKVHILDLTLDSSWDSLHHLATNYKVATWHFGLPCGTCSKARGIPLEDGSPGPPVLRTWEHLMGVPDMTQGDYIKVTQANTLYTKAAKFILWLLDNGHYVVLENPTNSWLWDLPMMRPVVARCLFVNFHACMFGAERKKKTSFLTNIEALQEMGIFCDEGHAHAEWGQDAQGNFNTAKEAQYPKKMCEVYIDIILHLCEALGWTAAPCNQIESKPMMQPRGRKTTPVIPEFKSVRSIHVRTIPPIDHKKKLICAIYDIPAGSKLLRAEAKRGGSGEKFDGFLCVFGIFHSMMEFCNIAVSIQHPFDDFMHIPDILIECVCDTLLMGPIAISKMRLQTIMELKALRLKLEKDEAILHGELPCHLKKLMADKQLLMLEKLAKNIGWPDAGLHDEMRAGFRLVGVGGKSNIFKPDFKPATITENELMNKSKFLRPALIGKLKSQSEVEHLAELHAITEAEATDKQWLSGPVTADQLHREFPDGWLPVTRFAVKQKNKIRPIDNFAENLVNDAWSAPEKLDLHSVDHVAWLLGIFCKMIFDKKCVEVTLKCGKKISGPLHKDWLASGGKCLLTTLDLKDAYKQFGIHKQDRNKAVVTLKSTSSHGVCHYIMNCLPFGAVSSVHNFNRVARLIWGLGVVLLKLPWLNYYDDYPMVSPAAISVSTMSAAKSFLHLLGFKFSEAKLSPFGGEAEILGVVVDSNRCDKGEIRYRMKESRREDILNELYNICNARVVIPAALPSSLGRIQFAEGQLHGRVGKLAMADIRELGLNSKQQVTVGGLQLQAFELLKSRFEENKERCLQVSSPGAPVVIFTDGSFEPDTLEHSGEKGVGGVMLRHGHKPEVFGCKVPTELLQRWHAAGKQHLIGQIELYGVLLAKHTWSRELSNRRSFFFIDNWGVLDCVIPGSSKDLTWREMLLKMEALDSEYPSLMWAARVPSESNLADPPSRGHMEGLEFLGQCIFKKPTCPMLGVQLECVI